MTLKASHVAPPLERRMVEGVSLLLRQGGPRTLVLLHGIGSEAQSFAPLIALLDPCWTVLAWDAPGYGSSRPLASDCPETADYADSLAWVLRRLGLDRVACLGHSLGAIMAAGIARRHTDLVERLVLSAPALGYSVRQGEGLPEPIRRRLNDYERLGPQAYAAARGPNLVHDAERRPEVTHAIVAAMSRLRQPGFAQALRLLASASLLDDVAQVSVPTLVIAGTEDQITPPANAVRAAAALREELLWPSNGPILVPGCGHALNQEKPAAVARHITAFLRAEMGSRRVG